VPSVFSTGSHAVCESSVPNLLGDAPMTPTGRPRKTRAMSESGRESQSIAFLNTPGNELLYSGVTSSKPSVATMRSLSFTTVSGEPCVASTSPS
jgi:hypothetical protein